MSQQTLPSTKEKIQHGTENFSLGLYSTFVKNHQEILYNHWHPEAEILCVNEGSMELVIDGSTRICEEKTMVLIPPNLLHGAYRHKKNDCSFTSIVFHPHFIGSKTEDLIQKQQIGPFLKNEFRSACTLDYTDRNNAIALQLLHEFKLIYTRQDEYRELLLKGTLFQLLYYLLKKEEKVRMKTKTEFLNENRKKKILFFINQNYHEDLSLDDLAKCLSLSREQFCRFFKQAFRTTPIQYLNQYRLMQASQLLLETDFPVTDIAFQVGFESPNYFSTSFKKLMTVTPSEYRKNTLQFPQIKIPEKERKRKGKTWI